MYEYDEMPFEVDETSDLPIWIQLRNRFAFLIRTGQFKEGDQLPSVRSLAAAAMINYNTVARAYRDLELEGLVVSIRGRGMFVRSANSSEKCATDPVDAVLEDCLHQYRTLGMSYKDIKEHIERIISGKDAEAETKARKRMECLNDENGR